MKNKTQIDFFAKDTNYKRFLPKLEPLLLEKSIPKPEKNESLDSYFTESDKFIRIPNASNFKYEPLEKFDEYILYDANPEHDLKKGPIRGFSRFYENGNELVWKECMVYQFIPSENSFIIQWPNTNIFKKVLIKNSFDFINSTKKVKRLNLMFENENEDDFQNRLEMAKNMRLKRLYLGNIESNSYSRYILLKKL